ncbi:MAG: hypothetical protein K2H92_01035 [Bacteroidaceae bacterium]|nr:hypothetical protein [Bacteroidaceae bacterium]
MKIRKTLAATIMLLLLCACQSDSYQEVVQPQRVTTIKASISNSNQTRAQVKYGTGQEQEREIFMWNQKDVIYLFNLSNLNKDTKITKYDIKELDDSNRKSAEFTFFEPEDEYDRQMYATEPLSVNAGDMILAVYGEVSRYKEGWIEKYENVFTYGVGTEENKPQYIVENPNDESLSNMKDNLKMYDVVKADDDGQIPDLHFKHLSALMRVTLRNETGKDLYLTKLEFNYPDTESFFNTTMYFSVNDDMTLKVYEDEEFFGSNSNPYTDNIGSTINGKNGTTDIGDVIRNGESYELYLSTVPRIGNNRKGDEFTIHIIEKHDTDNPYAITFNDFDTAIEAGKRYWFDLTATEDRKLVLTSEWEKLQNEQGGNTENNTQETDE